jgi:predicted nucleic acid-binding protein
MSTVSDRKSYYFDTNALLKYYRQERGSLEIQKLVLAAHLILVSPLTLLECYSVLLRYVRKKQLPLAEARLIIKRLHKDSGLLDNISGLFQVVPLPTGSFSKAESILLEQAGQFSFGANDALHVAIASLLPDKPIFVTSDKSLKNVCNNISLHCYDPEFEQ